MWLCNWNNTYNVLIYPQHTKYWNENELLSKWKLVRYINRVNIPGFSVQESSLCDELQRWHGFDSLYWPLKKHNSFIRQWSIINSFRNLSLKISNDRRFYDFRNNIIRFKVREDWNISFSFQSSLLIAGQKGNCSIQKGFSV